MAAGAVFLATVGYLFGVLPGTGWTIDMFDAPAALLTWVDGHERVYQGLWVLYFGSQLLLLPVPALLIGLSSRVAGVFGTVAVVLAMTVLVVLFAVSPVLARAYADAVPAGPGATTPVLVLHDAMSARTCGCSPRCCSGSGW